MWKRVNREAFWIKYQKCIKNDSDCKALANLQLKFQNCIDIIDMCNMHGSNQQHLVEIDKILAKKDYLMTDMEVVWKRLTYHLYIRKMKMFLSNLSNLCEQGPWEKLTLTIKTSSIPVFSPDGIILVQWSDKKIYIYDLHGSYVCKLKLAYKPFHVLIISDSRVVMSTRFNQVLFINYLHSMHLEKKCSYHSVCLWNLQLSWWWNNRRGRRTLVQSWFYQWQSYMNQNYKRWKLGYFVQLGRGRNLCRWRRYNRPHERRWWMYAVQWTTN